MKKLNLYTLTFLTVGFVILMISFCSFKYLYTTAKEDLFNSKFEAGKREAREIGKLLELQLQRGISREDVIQNLQNSITNTDTQSGFICMYNQNGIELCHPNPALIGQKIDKNNSGFTSSNISTAFIEILNSGKENTGIRNFSDQSGRPSEIVSVFPVQGSDWMVASHANTKVIEQQISNLYFQFLSVFLITVLVILAISFLVIRMIYKKYEAEKNNEIKNLNDEINILTSMNTQLNMIHEKLRSENNISKEDPAENSRKRMITYHKDELVTLETPDIAYFYLENNIVYAKTNSEKQYVINSSLDELIKTLDTEIFYRANRQFIINVKAIGNILIYGKNQLKLVVKPESADAIIISKNKVAEFKKWLEQ